MPDREKTIADLQKVVDVKRDTLEIDGLILNPFVIIPLMKDALALLKEQEAAYQGAEELLRQKTILFGDAIKRLKEQDSVDHALSVLRAHGWKEDRMYPEIILCKDCKHYRATPGYCAYDRIWEENKGHVWGMYCKPDWFCADGERA